METDDELLRKITEVGARHGFVSASMLQRRLQIGYNRAALLMDKLTKKGTLTQPDPNGVRKYNYAQNG